MSFEKFKKEFGITDEQLVDISFTGSALELAYNQGVRDNKQKVQEAIKRVQWNRCNRYTNKGDKIITYDEYLIWKNDLLKELGIERKEE